MLLVAFEGRCFVSTLVTVFRNYTLPIATLPAFMNALK